MTRTIRTSLLLVLVMFALPAFAKDKKKEKKEEEDVEAAPEIIVNEGDFKEDEAADEPKVERLKEDEKTEEKEDENLDFDETEEEPDLNFKDDDEQKTVAPRAPGEDTAQTYRDQQRKCNDMTPDEEQIAWEAYLGKYPKSLFRERIETHQEELSQLMFGERVPGSDKGERAVDAAKRELNFATPVKLTPVDPRSHVSAGFEWGFPTWFGGNLDFEYQFRREFSAHAGVYRDFNGGVIAVGGKYALLKSARTGTIASTAVDIKFNTAPFFAAVRPILSFGQRVNVMSGLDLQAQLAADIEFRASSDVRWFGGFHAELRPNEIVYVFAETSIDVKYLGSKEPQPFQFMVTTFGLKFVPRKAQNEQGGGRAVAGLSAQAPYSAKYWGFYQGGLGGIFDYYL